MALDKLASAGGGAGGDKIAAATKGAEKLGGAGGALDAAGKVQKLQSDPNLTNAVKAAGAVDKRAAVAGEVMEAGKKVTDTIKPTDEPGGDKGDSPNTGAGGTSVQPDASDKDGTVGDGKKIAAAGGAAAALASPLAFFLMLLNWLKTLFMAAVQMIMGWLAGLLAAVMNVVGAVVGFFTAIGSFISGLTSGAVSVGAAAASSFFGFVAGFVAIVVSVAGLNAGADLARKDAPLESCVAQVSQMQTAADISNATQNAQTEANAKRVYAIFSGMGMSDVNIAGILGNWTAESGVDPTGVETIYDEKFVIGPKKQAAQAVDFRIDDYNPAYGATYPAIEYSGIGLGQWTNGRNRLLVDYAKGINKPWYELDTQLGFMVSKDDPARVTYIKNLISTPAASVDAATTQFMSSWEGLTDGSTGLRLQAAGEWYAKMGTPGWEADKALADSILAQGGASLSGANNAAVGNAVGACRGAKVGIADNSSLAMAALSYAWPTTAEGVGNNGTPLFQELLQFTYPGDPYYMSCDRGVAVAVRWSGTDDTYPAGNVAAQLAYVETSPKWVEVQWSGDYHELQPGDVLLRSDSAVGHTVLYVGSELTQQVFAGKAGPQSVTVSASYMERSPGAGNWYTGSEGLNTYRAFRSTGKEVASQFSSYVPKAASMGNTTVGTGGSIPVSGGVTMPMRAGTYSLGAWFGKTGSWATYHTGQDLPAAVGTPVYAAASGTVLNRSASTTGWAGTEYVAIQHGSSGSTLYAHLDYATVRPGQTVTAGQQIGVVGMKGRTFGPHLHFEYYPPGVSPGNVYSATDPMTWLRSQGLS